MSRSGTPTTKEEQERFRSPEAVPESRAMKEDPGEVARARTPSTNSPLPSSVTSPRSHPAPVITNASNNRPPSALSVHSAGSGAGPRTTTTSRRGGRTRCRSPPTMSQRPSSTGPPPEPYPPSSEPGRRSVEPPSPANPSAAAAAAAAAAKSITRNPAPPSSWYQESPGPREREYRRPRDGPPPPGRYHGRYYEGSHPPRSNWPEEESGPPRPHSRQHTSQHTSPHSRQHSRGRGYGRPDDQYGYRDPGYYRRNPGRGAEQPYPQQYDDGMEYDPRSRSYPPPEHRFEEHRPRSTSPHRSSYEYRPGPHPSRESRHHGHPGHPPPHHRDEPYYKHGAPDDEGSRSEVGAPVSVKRTKAVIGGPTRIHVPRAPEPSSRSNSRGPNSVFRGRPGDPPPPNDPDNDDGPAKMLMSLSTSFEEKTNKDHIRESLDPLSPEAPPQIKGTTNSSLLFEPERSPKSHIGPPQQTNSIEMTGSFALFTNSFDSTGGDLLGMPLEAALNSTSFGVGPSASEDRAPPLELSHSNGASFQFLGASTSGGFTFEMSPNNSYREDNPPPPMRTERKVQVLGGGQDNRSSSPSQVLDMYRSYSGAERSPKQPAPLQESHRGMSGGSVRSPSIGAYSHSFGGAPPVNYRSNSMHESPDGSPHFYIFLRKHKAAFKECTFLLPGLKAALLDVPDANKDESAVETPKRHGYGEPSKQELAVAARRVISAICAFGGTQLGERVHQGKQGAQSIFREKNGDPATVTPGSSSATSSGEKSKIRQKSKYDEALPTRYYENDNRLSWEFEENPPVDDIDRHSGSHDDDDDEDKKNNKDGERSHGDDDGNDDKSQNDDDGKSVTTEDGKKSGSGGDQPKMRYRCKLCGQPKQNHTCPYQQSLARSIGTMVYPAVNAFTSAEPGNLAPALSEMNNFVGHSGSESVSSAETSPSRPTPDRLRHMNPGMPGSSAQVTPESLRGLPPRSVGSPVSTPVRARTPNSSRRGTRSHNRYTPGSSRSKKRVHGVMLGGEDQGDLLFVDSVDLKPEQFRIVTSSKALSSPDAFTYPSLPLPYAQRKRLSDNLFSLSKEVPQLTDECAAVLREAREKDLWDLAVAELMTQVVVVAHCREGDSRFEGLRRYLLTLGVSC